ncbi:unnamed protein product, partial [Prorocentrum cordatum]
MAATPIRSRRRCTGPPWSRAPHRRGERLLPTPPATACGPCTAPRRFWAKPAPAHRSCCPGRAAAGRLRVRLRNAQGQTHALPHLRSHAPEPQRDLAAGPPRVVLRDLAAAEKRRPPVSPQSSCLTWSWASPRAKRPPPTGRPAPSQATLSPQSCRHLGGRTRAGSRGACTRPRRTPCPRQSGRAHGRTDGHRSTSSSCSCRTSLRTAASAPSTPSSVAGPPSARSASEARAAAASAASSVPRA